MAKKASTRKSRAAPKRKKAPAKGSRAKRSSGRARATAGTSASDAFASLLQSPLVADLVAVAATSALAAKDTSSGETG